MAGSDGQRGERSAPQVGGVAPGSLSALLAELARLPPADLGTAWDSWLKPGAVIGRFELVREIGRGGFGVVYEARDRELGRSVAFKAVRAGGVAALREERLLREAETAARLSHPNIATLHDVGRTEHGPYLVLELLRGQTLEARLGQGRVPVREALRIGVEVARGVAHAHAQGVVHRDLKPSNVFLCEDGQVKVLDFGLAHAFGQRRADGGTPSSMAPEQWKGAPEDERTDVFALGVMLHRMLAAEPPFPEDDGGKAVRSARKAPALEVPEEPALGELVGKMLEKDPTRRPRDGGVVLAALSAFEKEMERSASTSSAPVRTRRRGLRLAGLLGAGIAFGVGIAAAGVWWTARAGRLARTSSIAPSPVAPVTLAMLPLANLSGDASQEYFSDGMTEEISGKLSRLGSLAVTAHTSVARYKSSPKDAREIGKELGVAYLVEGSVRRAGDRIRVSATLVRTADALQLWSESIDARLEDVLEVQERVATRIVEALRVRLSPDEAGSLGRWGTRNAAAYDEYLRGQTLAQRHARRENVDAARGHFERALQIDPAFAPAMAGLADVEAVTYRNFEESPERLKRARALLDRALAIDPGLPRALFTSALIRGVSHDYRGAAEEFRRVVAVEPRNFWPWDGLCWALAQTTPPELVEAERACRRSLELNPGAAETYYHLAFNLMKQGRLAEAEQAIDRVAELAPDSFYALHARSLLHLHSNRPREALAALGRMPDSVKRSLVLVWSSMALAQAGDLDGAFAALEEGLAKGFRNVALLHENPFLAPLRRDRRFAGLMAKHAIELGARSAGERSPTEPKPAPAKASPRPVPSIAVLPFADMSPKKDQEYFADGVAEEILNSLARVQGLKVIGRTSSFSFKGKSADLPSIGRKLDVAHVLEGSLRQSGNRVRVTAQLVRAADGSHLWSETYDRTLDDVFEVQDAIAKAVVAALKVRLLPGRRPEYRTANHDAYTSYLLGRHFARSFSADGQRRASAAFEKAVGLDPSYAPGWAALSQARLQSGVVDAIPWAEARRGCLAAADRAVELAPDLAEGLAMRAHCRLFEWDWAGAKADIDRSLALDPEDVVALAAKAAYLFMTGAFPEAVGLARRTVEKDPLDGSAWNTLGVTYWSSGRLDRARAAFSRAIEVDPQQTFAPTNRALLALDEGPPAEALAACEQIPGSGLVCLACAHHALGHTAQSEQALKTVLDRAMADRGSKEAERGRCFAIAVAYACRGQADEAFEWLERCYEHHVRVLNDIKGVPEFRALRSDPRYKALLRKMNLPVD